MTKNLESRLKEHNAGKTKSTKFYAPWEILYTEKFYSREDAREREKKLKSGYGKEFFRSMLDIAPIAQMDRAGAS